MKEQESISLLLTYDYFEKLLNAIHDTYLKKHNLKRLPKSFQLYGYGNYNMQEPNLKEDFEATNVSNDSVNGKYLYDKAREYYKGKPIIKLNSYYKELIFMYLNYENALDFINNQDLDNDKREQQLALIFDKKSNETFYYLNYYFGEDNTIIKGYSVISNNWKKIKHTFIYRDSDGTIKELYNYGRINRREDTIHIKTKTLLDGKMVEGDNETYYIGHKDPSNINFLVGTYTSYDIYTNTVAGKIILEKCESKEIMEEKSKNMNIPSYIAQEIRNQRITNPAIVPQHYLELSENSPYSSIYGKLPGTYTLNFSSLEDFNEIIKFKILQSNYKIVPISEDVYFENDTLELMNKGSIVHFSFRFAGIISLDMVDVYFKSYYLKEDNEVHDGVFSGIDNENRLVSGQVSIKYSPHSL